YVAPGAALRAAGPVAVTAQSSNVANADASDTTVSVAGIGTSEAAANASGSARAHMDGAVSDAGSLSVAANTSSASSARSAARSVGLLNGIGAQSTAAASPSTQAYIGNGAGAQVRGDVAVTSQSVEDASADAPGFVIGLGLGAGKTAADTHVDPDVRAYVGDRASVAAGGGVTLQAAHD